MIFYREVSITKLLLLDCIAGFAATVGVDRWRNGKRNAEAAEKELNEITVNYL